MGVHSVVHTPKHTIRQQAAAVTLQKNPTKTQKVFHKMNTYHFSLIMAIHCQFFWSMKPLV